jgi:hypothetical protein
MGEVKEMTVQLDLDFMQVKKLVDRLSQKEKETLARHLDNHRRNRCGGESGQASSGFPWSILEGAMYPQVYAK